MSLKYTHTLPGNGDEGDASRGGCMGAEVAREEAVGVSEHAGMVTRREVLELIVKRHRQYLEATNSASRSEHWGAVGGLSQVLGWPPAPGLTVHNAAHELALLMNEERGEDE